MNKDNYYQLVEDTFKPYFKEDWFEAQEWDLEATKKIMNEHHRVKQVMLLLELQSKFYKTEPYEAGF